MKQIKVGPNHFAIIDDEDFEYINSFTWSLNLQNKKKPRAFSQKLKTYMHRLIMNCSKGMQVDHIDGNPLNNQKSNLRICTLKENCRNVEKRKHCSSIYKGVHFEKYTKKWRAQITVNNKEIKLGRFLNEKDAAIAYDKAAMFYFKEFSYLNFKP
jgi:hypothetical protein